jgi:hypothetical protein
MLSLKGKRVNPSVVCSKYPDGMCERCVALVPFGRES